MRRLAAALAASIALAAPHASAKTPEHHAGLLIRDAQGHVRRMCIFFDGASITGLQMLQKSGYSIELEQSSLGSAVCKLGSSGCSSGKCFCHYPTFWGYWTREKNSTKWRFSDAGAQARSVHDGAMDAWVWGKNGGPAPKAVTFDEVCPVSASAVRRTNPQHRKTNYAAFAGFVAFFALSGVLLARRRATRRP